MMMMMMFMRTAMRQSHDFIIIIMFLMTAKLFPNGLPEIRIKTVATHKLTAVATSTTACHILLSISWSESMIDRSPSAHT
jgi:hypothetical protein